MLQLKGIKKDYITSSETVSALKGVSISFRQKEFVSVLGPSGCGKTTLLNIIGGLDHYTDGDLLIAGRSTKSYGDRDWDVYRNHRIGFIFQSYNLIPHQTVLGNVELALTISGISREERIRRAKTALDRVGLSDQYYKRPNQLSGGQCQRVAIARALVNDPEILLADEPTGALDTVTSKQIMDLIKEISGERLVIMVTHNPEIADEYSSRIIRLLDGMVIEDSNPFSPEEESAECERINAAEMEAELLMLKEAESDANNAGKTLSDGKKKALLKKKKERAKMSFFTAFMLSARNLISKRGRTTMVAFAGSIGIIGIALVLAFSAGIKGYIASMQDDMLSGNPITITETAYDLNALTGMMSAAEKAEVIEKLEGHVYVSSVVEYLAKMGKDLNEIVTENTLTEEYIDYVKSMPPEHYNAMLFGYGIDPSLNTFADFRYSSEDEVKNLSVKNIVDIYTSVLKGTQFGDTADRITMLIPSFEQAPSNIDYINSQYDLVGEGSKIAESKNEIMLVLNGDDEISDLLLAMLGYFTQEEFEAIIHKAIDSPEEEYVGLYRDSFTYEQLLGKTFTWYPNDTVFTNNGVLGYGYNHDSEGFTDDGAVELTVVGILKTKDNVNYGCLTSGVYYTEALTEHMLAENSDSDFVNYLKSDESASLAATYYNILYSYKYIPWEGTDEKLTFGYVGPQMTLESIMGSLMGGSGSGGNNDEQEIDAEDMRQSLIRSVGGNGTPNKISIYPLSFDEKDYVTDYLDAWNEEGDIVYGDTTLKFEDRVDITYTDALELVITMINTMIDVVSYALIAFTSVSLVVSTVMIGIITYVSVVERIKEIGVIRSLGGRKKDVSHLFNAETFIIGLLAGAFGIGVTYIVSLVINLILNPIINYSKIAALPFTQALILIALSIGLTLISGLIPASNAAKRDPVVALRTE